MNTSPPYVKRTVCHVLQTDIPSQGASAADTVEYLDNMLLYNCHQPGALAVINIPPQYQNLYRNPPESTTAKPESKRELTL